MEDSKIWWQSKTIWTSIVSLIMLIAAASGAGTNLTSSDIGAIVDMIMAVIGGISGLAAIVSRFMASKQLTLTSKTDNL